jgi:hypothetical protein
MIPRIYPRGEPVRWFIVSTENFYWVFVDMRTRFSEPFPIKWSYPSQYNMQHFIYPYKSDTNAHRRNIIDYSLVGSKSEFYMSFSVDEIWFMIILKEVTTKIVSMTETGRRRCLCLCQVHCITLRCEGYFNLISSIQKHSRPNNNIYNSTIDSNMYEGIYFISANMGLLQKVYINRRVLKL